ncbi:MAG TPA: class I poly(R)-hydroxyalkanoic acid synthase [Burkholderiales bacterium]|nr:class I poly(R)-hydroxyalkanoic acid synthase [Burkholderiales bacterium]
MNKPTPDKSLENNALPDSQAMAKIFAEVSTHASKLLQQYLERQAKEGLKVEAPKDELGIAKAFMDLWAAALANPWPVIESQMKMFWDYTALWNNSLLRLMGQPVAPLAAPVQGDNRFRDEEWQNRFLFDYLKQSYLIAARDIHDAVSQVQGVPADSRRKIDFYTRQYLDAVAPSNFALTNPQVLRETLQSGGQNLIRGMDNLLADLERGKGELRIRMTDEKAFKLGGNVATTPGKVVHQSDLAQLIQYEPLTKEVARRPLLIIPPWINKYYILDLRPENSFIRWALEQGHTVFVISWVNPDERHAAKTFDDYMLEGPLAALDAIEQATGEKSVNAIGYCLGGTLLAGTLARMAAHKDDRVATATYFVSMLDFSEPGDLGVFVDDEQITNIERKMQERGGYMEGAEMATTFNMLRANDLIWSFVINNYLLGKEPFPFDLLYWNSDSTRMPARMHSFYLRNMYMKNALVQPCGISLAGTPIDLRKITTPSYFVSTAEDHIAPWKSTYKGARLLVEHAKVRFVLGGSGHIAGIINPPAAKKYGYWTNPQLPESAAEWQKAAEWHTGSWWPDWQAWMGALNGDEKVPARKPGEGGLKVIEDAPGTYVSFRLTDAAATAAKKQPASRKKKPT